MSNGSTLILGPSAGSSSVVFTGGIGNSVTVTVNANSICAPNGASNGSSYTLNDGSIMAVVYNQGSLTTALDTSGSPATIVANTSSVVCGVLVDGTNTENGNTVTIYGSVTLNGGSAFLGTYINSGSAAASSNAVALNGPLTVNGSAVVLTVAGSIQEAVTR
jgi:phage baseplate assembly protein gpV